MTICVFIVALLPAQFADAQWVQANGPYGGDIECLATTSDRSGGRYLFAGTQQGGIFRSTNDGTSWTRVYPAPGVMDVRCLAVLPGSGVTRLFAGTYPRGVFLSTDYGLTWAQAGSGSSDLEVKSITMGPGAGPGETNLFAGTTDGVFLSTDNGTSWTLVDTTMSEKELSCIAAFADSSDPSGVVKTYLFAGTWGEGVFRSTDYGSSWTQMNTGLTTLDAVCFASTSEVADTGGAKRTNVFVGTWAGGVFRSTDFGATWAPAGTGGVYQVSRPYCLTACTDGAGKTYLFAGTTAGLRLSTNHGTSWSRADSGLANWNFRSLAAVTDGTTPPGGGIPYIFAGTVGGGVFRSTNTAASWTQVNEGLANTNVLSLAVVPAGAGQIKLFAGTGPSGAYCSTNDGGSWSRDWGITGNYIYALAFCSTSTGGANLFAAALGHGVFRSTNKGTSWTMSDSGLSDVTLSTLAVSTDRSGPPTIFAGTLGVGIFRSTDNGLSWAEANSGLSNKIVNCITVNTESGGTASLFAGTYGGGVFRSTNDGVLWAEVNEGLFASRVGGLAVGSNGTGGVNVFAATSGWGVFRSTDNGSHWVQINEGLTNPNVNCIFASPKGSGDSSVFAGTGTGVFYSSNNGTKWANVSSGLTGLSIKSLAVSPAGSSPGGMSLIAGTYGHGVWLRPLSEMLTSVENLAAELPHGFSLGQNFPNPFNPGTTITYKLPKSSEVKLSVFDLLGREVSVLVNERVNAGIHEAKFDASGLSSGVYFYKMQARPLDSAIGRDPKSGAGSYVETRKFILVR